MYMTPEGNYVSLENDERFIIQIICRCIFNLLNCHFIILCLLDLCFNPFTRKYFLRERFSFSSVSGPLLIVSIVKANRVKKRRRNLM